SQNPKVFFQREDVWSIAQQIKVNEKGEKVSEAIDPYYVTMQLPGEQQKKEFVVILPFTPGNRNNLIGWMAGRSDGDNYGKLVVYNFPKSRLIDGPVQIESRIDQKAQLSGQFTLWNQQGSRVIRGHLLVIPMGRSLLFVEPIYLQAVRSPMPELRLVVLATQERLGYGTNFDEAMTSLFGDTGKPQIEEVGKKPEVSPSPGPTKPAAPPPVPPPGNQTVQKLVNQAIQEFE